MLVLSRRRDESIMIGEDIEVMVIDIHCDKIRLGIAAPKSVPVHRREVYKAIKRGKFARRKMLLRDKRQRLYKTGKC